MNAISRARTQDDQYALIQRTADAGVQALADDYHEAKREANYLALKPRLPGELKFDGLIRDLKAKRGRLLLVGAGPSLAKHIGELHKLADKFVIICADICADRVRAAIPNPDNTIYVINVDSDPKGILGGKFENQRVYPDGFALLAQIYSCVEVVEKFKRVVFFTTSYMGTRFVREAASSYPELPVIQTASTCMGTANVIGVACGAQTVAALGIDLAFGIRETEDGKKTWDVTERDRAQIRRVPLKVMHRLDPGFSLAGRMVLSQTPVNATVLAKPGENANGHLLSTLGYLRARDEFGGIIAQSQAARGVKYFDFGDGLFPAPKVKINEFLRRVKHGEL